MGLRRARRRRADQARLVGEHDRLHPVAEPSLRRMAVTWVLTVASPTNSAAAISALLQPAAELEEHLALPRR